MEAYQPKKPSFFSQLLGGLLGQGTVVVPPPETSEAAHPTTEALPSTRGPDEIVTPLDLLPKAEKTHFSLPAMPALLAPCRIGTPSDLPPQEEKTSPPESAKKENLPLPPDSYHVCTPSDLPPQQEKTQKQNLPLTRAPRRLSTPLNMSPQQEKASPTVPTKKPTLPSTRAPRRVSASLGQPSTLDSRNIGTALVTGMVLCEQYRIVERIGCGGVSTVWKCLDQDSEEHVALKIYTNEASFSREIKFMHMFQHPRILKHKDAFGRGRVKEWPEHCMATFPLGHESLQEMYIRRRQGLDVTQVRFIVFDILDALEALQARSVVHCDLKPANIIVTTVQGDIFPHFMLIDFDAACMVDEPVTHATIDYRAPEQKQGTPATFSMDLFALGRIIHWLSSTDKNIWPDLNNPTNKDKETFLRSMREFSRNNIPNVATKRIVRNLTCKDPTKRYTLQQVKVPHSS